MESIKGSVIAANASVRSKPSNYPEPFASRMAGREKRPLGDIFGLNQFGINLTTLKPGAVSALHHQHSLQDEWVYVLSGEVTLYIGAETFVMRQGECVGFPAGGEAHHTENRSSEDATIIEVGSRPAGDAVNYPSDDLVAVKNADDKWGFARKDGRPY